MPCTAPIITLLEPFRPVFTAPTWKKLLTLFRGTVLARGRRTVTTALWYTGHQQDPHFRVFHHVLNRARWSPLQASQHLLTFLRETFGHAGGTLDIVMDETHLHIHSRMPRVASVPGARVPLRDHLRWKARLRKVAPGVAREVPMSQPESATVSSRSQGPPARQLLARAAGEPPQRRPPTRRGEVLEPWTRYAAPALGRGLPHRPAPLTADLRAALSLV